MLIIITLAVYWQVGEHEFLNFDDNDYVTTNSHVSSGITASNVVWAFTSVHSSNWHPITWLSHMLDAQLFGMNPRGHHLMNIIIHAMSAVLLLLLFHRLTGSIWQSSFVAALFALHPLHVESVAWVAERKDVLSAFFGFLTLLLYSIYVGGKKPTAYLLALFSFVLGLMSKSMLVTLPFVMLLLDFWPLNRCCLKKDDYEENQSVSCLPGLIIEKIPFFVCSLLSSAVTIYAQHKGEAIRTLDLIPFQLRIENAVIAYVKYIVLTFWPHDLAILYPLPASYPLWEFIVSLIILTLISTAAIWYRRIYPFLTAGWLWFVITLLPVIGLIQVGNQSMADRYIYIPHIGLFIMAAWGVPILTKRWQYRQYLLGLSASLLISVAAICSWKQVGYWRNDFSLFRHTIQVTEGNCVAHNVLGVALDNSGDLDGAIREYQDALATNPHYFEAHNNLGFALAKKGYFDAAIREYQEALTVNATSFEAHFNLGNALANKGEWDDAIKEYQEALKKKPDEPDVLNNMGIAQASGGNFDAAINEYRRALAIRPNDPDVHNNLANALSSKGDLDAAIMEYQEALSLNPDAPGVKRNLEKVLDKKGRNEPTLR